MRKQLLFNSTNAFRHELFKIWNYENYFCHFQGGNHKFNMVVWNCGGMLLDILLQQFMFVYYLKANEVNDVKQRRQKNIQSTNENKFI